MTVSDIAREAGVSITTVSRVLNNNPSVRPETAQQVRNVLDRQPYDRTAVRRGPRPGKRRNARWDRELHRNAIAIVVLGIRHERWFKQPLFASIVSSITREAAGRHLSVRIEEVLSADAVSDGIHPDVVDGALVFISSFASPDLLKAVSARVPTVRVMGDDLIPLDVDQVRVDNLAVGGLALRHLHERGCRHVACVTTRPDHGGFLMRAVAFTASALQAGLPRPTFYAAGPVRASGDYFGVDAVRCDSLDEAARRIAAASPRPTGIFVTQDVETIGLYPYLMGHGLRPGHDVHVVSCNNEQSLSLLHPRPATIDLDAPAIGRWALRRLINRVSRPSEAPIQMLIKPSLVGLESDEML